MSPFVAGSKHKDGYQIELANLRFIFSVNHISLSAGNRMTSSPKRINFIENLEVSFDVLSNRQERCFERGGRCGGAN